MILHQNIRSFNKNFDQFSAFIDSLNRKVDVFVFSETWFKSDNCTDIAGYVGYHSCRNDRTGGGVSVYVRSEIKSNFREELSDVTDLLETCVVDISPNGSNEKITVVGVYSCLLYTSPSPRDKRQSRMPSSA